MRDTTEAYRELRKQQHGGTVLRKVGAFAKCVVGLGSPL